MRIHRRLKDVELPEEARCNRKPEKRKQVDAQRRRHPRLPLGESRVIIQREILFPRAAELRNDRERPQLHQRIADQIKEHRSIGRCSFRRSAARHGGNCRKSHQNIARVRNRTVRQEPLDVCLH